MAFEAVTEALSGIVIGLISGTVAFFIVLVLAFIYRYFTLEKLSSFIGIVFGLGFLGFSGGLLAILEQPSVAGVVEVIVVVIFTVWGVNIGDKIADKIPKRSGALLTSLVKKEAFTKIKLPPTDFILDMPGKKRIPDSVKAELSEQEFILPVDLRVEDVPQWIKRRLAIDWGIGDVEIDIDKEGKVTHFVVSAKEEGLSSMLPSGFVALPVCSQIIPSGLVSGDIVRIIFGNGEVIDEAEVVGVNSTQNSITIIAPFEWVDKIRGNKAELLIGLPNLRQKQRLMSVRQKSGSIEAFTADKIFVSLKEKGVKDDTAKKTVSKVEARLVKIANPVSTEVLQSIIIEELEKIDLEEAKKIKNIAFWKL